MIRAKGSRVLKKPQKVRECEPSPEKSNKKARNSKTLDEDKVYKYDTVGVCTCSIHLWVLVHFCGYPDSDDEWRPATDLPDPVQRHSKEKNCRSITAPLCPTRLLGVMGVNGRGVGAPSSASRAPASSPVTSRASKPSPNTVNKIPSDRSRRSVPPVPIFPPSPPLFPEGGSVMEFEDPEPLESFPPSFAVPFDSILADPAISLPVAAAKRMPLAPEEPYDYVPDMDEFMYTLLDSVNLSMSHSFGADFWRSEGAGTWKVIREEVCISLEAALLLPNELSIFQATVDLLLAPTRLLRFLGFTRPPVTANVAHNPTLVSLKLASDAIKRGQSGKALRILTGTGSAPHTSEQLARTAELFPEPKKPVFFITTDDLLPSSPSFFLKKFSKLVSAAEPESPDVYGWDPILFKDFDASTRFTHVVSRFLSAFVGWSFAPPICSSLFACSSLISIYKLHASERELLPPDKKHGIRPIGGQCLFGKMMDRQVNDTEDAKDYRSSLLPVQRAFLSRGVSSIPIAALGALRSGFAVAKGDVRNAFQEICRVAALNNIQRAKPALANCYSRTLCTRIPMITRNVNGQIEIIWSSTGAPQGSVPGTTIYNAGVSRVYETLRMEFPDFFLTAATDDLISFFKPDDDDDDSWQAQYETLARFLTRYEELLLEWCSLRQNLSKSALILPTNAPPPSLEVRALFPQGFKFLSCFKCCR